MRGSEAMRCPEVLRGNKTHMRALTKIDKIMEIVKSEETACYEDMACWLRHGVGGHVKLEWCGNEGIKGH